MSEVINFEEIKLAKRVVQDFPELLIKLDNCKQILYNNSDYIDIAKVIRQIDESVYTMELILGLYQEILKQNGVAFEQKS